jgi:hypothetical protein
MPQKIDIEASKNEDFNKLKVSDLNKRLHKIHEGGGEKRIAKLHKQGKMTARERIDAPAGPQEPAHRDRCLRRRWHVQRAWRCALRQAWWW